MLRAFSKYQGCGNDFILIDNRSQPFFDPYPALITRLCHRHFGIGADGLILLETSAKADFGMRIFNSDGSEAEMCGNGIRCLKHFIETLGHQDLSCTISTSYKVFELNRRRDLVSVQMGPVTDVAWNLNLPVGDRFYIGHYLDTGVPHLVIFVEELEQVPLLDDGRALRYHSRFHPRGVNVNFVAFQDGRWSYRTYERGVEGETLACGTGAMAAALAIQAIQGGKPPIGLKTRSGEMLEIAFDGFAHVEMGGPATLVYQGVIDLKFFCSSELQSANMGTQA